MPPTLLEKGKIKLYEYKEYSKKYVDNLIGIDFISEYIKNLISRTPETSGDRVIILKSATGSGKSTVIAPRLYKDITSHSKKNIAITQPRVLTAIDISLGLPKYSTWMTLDENLGYQTGNYKRLPAENGVIFMTIGILVQQLNVMEIDDFIDKYQIIMIDEAHERDINIDSSISTLKLLLEDHWDNPNFPIILIMSATLDVNLFKNYFKTPAKNIIEVSGRQHTIHHNYVNNTVHNYIMYASYKSLHIHLNNPADLNDSVRDIIIFVDGMATINKVIKYIEGYNHKLYHLEQNEGLDLSQCIEKMKDFINDRINVSFKAPLPVKYGGNEETKTQYPSYVLPIILNRQQFSKGDIEYRNLYSHIYSTTVPIYSFDKKTGKKTFVGTKTPTRRIIIATNIAETGITIDTLKYCIENGFSINSEFNPEYGIYGILSKPINLSGQKQRVGRVGRVAEGYSYTSYSKKTLECMNKSALSKFISDDITEVLLNIIIKKNGRYN